MLCEHCRQNKSVVYLTKIENNKKVQLSLCEKCAGEYQQQFTAGSEPTFSINQFLTNLFSDTSEAAEGQICESEEACPTCGFSYPAFMKIGKLGCGYCYEIFQDKLESVLKRIHGSSTHAGKFPEKIGGKVKVQREMKKLKSTLQKLVAEEKFEEAAEVRDKIKELEQSQDM